jgi:hypothetical protein
VARGPACHDVGVRGVIVRGSHQVAAVLLLAGCWSTTEVAPVAPSNESSTVKIDAPSSGASMPTSSRSRHRGEVPPHSVWEGTYVCNQGMSSVTLTIDVDRKGNATARYDFGPVPSNPTVPVGAYALTGTVTRQPGGGFTGSFETTEWILHPTGYFMVPLTVETGDGRTMTGKIQHQSCHSFQTTRIQ